MKKVFDGFNLPKQNWSKLPHQFIETLPLVETISEMKVILYVLRHTWGYQDDLKKITIDEFINGRKRKDGTRIDNGIGLTAKSVRDGINRAIEHGFLVVITDDRDKARTKKYYGLKVGGESLPPGRESLPPGGVNFNHRTEKETIETNLKKEAHSQDYLDSLFPGKEGGYSERTGPNPFDQHFGYRDDFLKAHQSAFQAYPSSLEKEEIVKVAQEEGADLDVWQESYRQTILNWTGRGKPPLARVIEVYRQGGDYERWRRWKYGDKDGQGTLKKIKQDKDGGMYV